MADLSSSQSLTPIDTYDFLPSVNRWVTVGGWFMFLTMVGVIAASCFVKYRTTVKAPAIIRPAGEPRLIQVPTAGTVVSMRIMDNTAVQQGDIIAQLETANLEVQSSQLSSSLAQGNSRLQQIDAQLLALDQQLAAEIEQSQREVAAFSAAYEQIFRESRDQSVTAQAAVEEAQAQLDLAEEEVRSFRELAESGAISRLQLAERESDLASARARMNSLKSALNPSPGNVQAAQARIEQAQASGKATKARLQQAKQQLFQQKLEIQEQLQATEQEILQLDLELKNAVVRSPITGVIHEFSLRNTGQVVNRGETIAKVIPADSPILIKALIPTQEINKIEVGLPTQLRVSACPFSEFGSMTGAVREISPDTVTSNLSGISGGASLTSQGGSFYNVIIDTDGRELVSKQQETCKLLPGAEGEVTIISREETVISFLRRKASLITSL